MKAKKTLIGLVELIEKGFAHLSLRARHKRIEKACDALDRRLAEKRNGR